jgi:uncharacterized protein (DUF2141 family)
MLVNSFPMAGVICAAMLAIGPPAYGQSQLIVNVTGFKDSAGQAVAKLFLPGDNVLGPGRWQLTEPITQGISRFAFDELDPGSYALVVFHDRNANGTIDHNSLRMPSEPLGFSNSFELGIFSGLPSFEKLKFAVVGPQTVIDVKVRGIAQ